MSIWGPKANQNDDASDWLNDLNDKPSLRVVRSTIDRVNRIKGYIDTTDGAEAIIAAEVLAEISAAPRTKSFLSKEALSELKQALKKQPASEVANLFKAAIVAVQTVVQISKRSELRQHWNEADKSTAWINTSKDLLKKLGRAPKALRKWPSAEPTPSSASTHRQKEKQDVPALFDTRSLKAYEDKNRFFEPYVYQLEPDYEKRYNSRSLWLTDEKELQPFIEFVENDTQSKKFKKLTISILTDLNPAGWMTLNNRLLKSYPNIHLCPKPSDMNFKLISDCRSLGWGVSDKRVDSMKDIDSLGHLDKLTKLILTGFSGKPFSLAWLANLNALTSLTMTGPFSDEETLGKASNLETLEFHNFSSKNLDYLGNLKNLRELELDTQVKSIEPEAFMILKELKKLRKVNISLADSNKQKQLAKTLREIGLGHKK